MLKKNSKSTTPWPQPTYTSMANIRQIIYDINRDVKQHYAFKFDRKVKEFKRIEDGLKQPKGILSLNEVPNPADFPYVYNASYPTTILINKTVQKPEKMYAKFPKSNMQRSISGSTSRSSRNEIRFNNRFSNNNSYDIIKSSDQIPYFEMSHYSQLRKRALAALADRKIFTVYGNYVTIRKALVQRGWIEKIESNYLRNLQTMTQLELIRHAKTGNDYEKMSLSKMVYDTPSYFIWQPRNFRDYYSNVRPYRNRIRLSKDLDFSSKVGLISCAEHSRWYTINGVAEIKYPRFHSLSTEADRRNFLFDYRITQALSFLIFLTSVTSLSEIFEFPTGTVDVKSITFAIAVIENTLKSTDEIVEPSNINDKENWRLFFHNSRTIINREAKFRADSEDLIDVISRCKRTLSNAKRVYKTLHMDGYKNLWIVKPGYQCRGSGIYIFNEYESIMTFINKNPKNRYVAQKYIERPLLIYNTKFDIRQYLLVTLTDKINIWLYKDCYFRFSSQEFTLQDLRESIHLTNNSIQRKYPNGKRNQKLPPHNMWHLSQYQHYLREIGKNDTWDKITYPGIKRAVTALILTSAEGSELARNSFELYGCDFMLDENFEPILIEINATPDMTPSTVVTAKICPATLDDLVKVVVDLPKDRTASTGDFELVYQLETSFHPTNIDEILAIGTKIKTPQTLIDITPVVTKDHHHHKPSNSKFQSSTLSRSHKKLKPIKSLGSNFKNVNVKKSNKTIMKRIVSSSKKRSTTSKHGRQRFNQPQRLEQRNQKKNSKKRKTVFTIYPYKEATYTL